MKGVVVELELEQDEQRLGGAAEHLLFLRILGDLVLVTGRAQGAELIDLGTKRATRVIGHGKPADALCALPVDGGSDTLLVGGPDGMLRQYDPLTGALRRQQVVGHGAIRDLDATELSDGRLVAIASEGGVRLWAPSSGETVAVNFAPRPQRARPFRICFSGRADALYLVCAFTDGWLATWSLDAVDQEPRWRQAHSGPIWTLANLAGESDPMVASGGSDRALCVWRIAADGSLGIRQRFEADGTIRRLDHAVDGEGEGRVPMLATASATGAVSLWRYDGPADRPLLEAARHRGEAYAIACANTADGVIVASGDFNGDIEISYLSSNVLKSMRTVFRTDGPISAVAGGHSDSGAFIAGAGASGRIHVVDPHTGAQRHSFLHGRAVRALAASGNHLISSGLDHRVLDWDVETGRLRSELPMGHSAEVHALATVTHRNVVFALSGALDGTVQRCPLEDPEASTEIASGCGQVTALDVVCGLAAGATMVVIGSTQGLYQVSMDEPGVVHLIAPHSIQALCVVFDGRSPRVVAARTDGSVDMYDPLRLTQITAYAAPFPARPVRALSSHLSARGDALVLGGCDEGYLLKWRIDGRLVGAPSRSGRSAIRSLCVNGSAGNGREPARSVLLTAGDDASIREWQISPDQPLVSGGAFGKATRAASLLLQDQPADSDLLAREALTRTIVDVLTAEGTSAPVVIGIHAPWGQGKSSVLKQIQGTLDPGSAAAADAPRRPGFELRQNGKLVDNGRITSSWAWKRLQQRIEEDRLPYEMVPVDDARRAITVWFNPWMYENPDQVWAGLTQEITRAVMQRLPDGQRRRLFFDLNLKRTGPEAMRRQILASVRPSSIRGLAAVALVVLAAVTTIVGAVAALVTSNKLSDIVGVALGTFLVALAVTGRVLYSSLKGFPTWFDPAAVTRSSSAGVLPREADGNTGDPLENGGRGYLYLLQHDVRDLIDLATRHAAVYIFVDDLDRCSPAVVANTIEAVNLFLTKAFGPCNFVLALDPATVAAHLETAHPSIHERAADDPASFGHLRHTGWRFMEKIVDLPIRLPRIPDAAIANYLNELLNADPDTPGPEPVIADAGTRLTAPAANAVPAPRTPRENGHQANQPVADARPGTGPRSRRLAAFVGDSRQTPPADAPAPGDVRPANATSRMEDVPLVRDALANAVLNLPGRNPRQTKAFINLWRFYMVLEYELGYMTNSITATRVHSAEMARLVEIMVRWPWLLDTLGTRLPVGSTVRTVLADLMRASGDDEEWIKAATCARMSPLDESTEGLRELLQRRGTEPDTLIAIASRYL